MVFCLRRVRRAVHPVQHQSRHQSRRRSCWRTARPRPPVAAHDGHLPARKGVPLATIQVILGHATIGVTMGYIDATALDALGAAKAAMTSAFDDIRASAGA